MLYRKVKVTDRLPEKEGRYIVGWDENLTSLDGKHSETIHVIFQADYNERYSFHEEYSDCSRVEWWLEKVKEPTDEEIEAKSSAKCKERMNAVWPLYQVGYEDGYKQALKDLKGE